MYFINISQNILSGCVRKDVHSCWPSITWDRNQDNTIVKALKTIISKYLRPISCFFFFLQFRVIYRNTNLISNATKLQESRSLPKTLHLQCHTYNLHFRCASVTMVLIFRGEHNSLEHLRESAPEHSDRGWHWTSIIKPHTDKSNHPH